MKPSQLFRQPTFALFIIQLVLAYEWLHGAWGKLSGGTFVAGMSGTLAHFIDKNPHAWYVSTYLEMAKAYPALFGQLVQWGELLTSLGLLAGIIIYLFVKTPALKPWAAPLAIVSLAVGAFMNANFYFAAGWTSPSTGGLNAVMFWAQIALILFWINSRSIGKQKA